MCYTLGMKLPWKKRVFTTKNTRLRDYELRRKKEFTAAGLCGKCGKEPIASDRSKILGIICLDKAVANRQQWWDKNQEECRRKQRESDQVRRALYKDLVFNHYGKLCACCGETEEIFLQIDHVNGGGNKHRKDLYGSIQSGAGYMMYRYLIENDFPPEFQVLCANCNFGKWRNKGICPHKRKAALTTTVPPSS